MSTPPSVARDLISGELFDLILYKKLLRFARGDTAAMLGKLIPVEEKHYAFWQDFFQMNVIRLTVGNKIKLYLLVTFARIFGEVGIHLVLESLEVHGIRKYLEFWKTSQKSDDKKAVAGVLHDEFGHEDEIVSEVARRKIHPERVRDIFLGFNDGLVEVLGAIAGFFAAFQSTSSVLAAGFTVAIAGSLSMAAGAFAAISSEQEVGEVENGKKEFLGEKPEQKEARTPLGSALVVGISYFIGAMIPVTPVILGAKTAISSISAGAILVIFVSYIIATLSGMRVGKRITTNIIIIALAVSVTYTIGIAAKNVLGIEEMALY